MAELVANCPRCGSRHITFDVTAAIPYRIEYGWQNWYEAFGICRHCGRTTIFVLSESVNGNYDYVHKVGLLKVEGALNNYVDVKGTSVKKTRLLSSRPNFFLRKSSQYSEKVLPV
jgi:hypothetical protein